MATRSYVLVALVLSAALLGQSVAAAAPEATPTPFQQSPLHDKPPLDWSVRDVEYWMNHTIGYAEYAGYIRAHLVDGVTLLEMEPADFESYLPIENALHAVKIAAHVKLLKGLCKCSGEGDAAVGSARVGFWDYMKAHSVRTWVWGTTAMFFPRWAMAGVYLVDREIYLDVVGMPAPAPTTATAGEEEGSQGAGRAAKAGRRVVSTGRAAVYWVSCAFAPDLYMAAQAARLTPRNYILMPCFIAHFLAQAFSECSLLITIYRGTAFKAGTPLLEKVWNIFSYTLFAPVLGVVVGYIFPTFLQYITVAVIIAHSFLMILGIVILVMRDGLAAATTGPEDPIYRAAAAAAAEAEAAAPSAASDEKGGEEGMSKSEKID